MKSAAGNLDVAIVGAGDRRMLRVIAADASALREFEGSSGQVGENAVVDGPLSPANAAALRSHVPSLRPQPIGLVTSAGVGDRLGLATTGQVRAFQKSGHGVVPVFAQQSIREMDRLGRSPQQVLDDATFGTLQGGWEGSVGADADHLKTTEDIDRCLQAGFTSFTLDPGEHVRDGRMDLSNLSLAELPWAELEDDAESMTRRYADLALESEVGVLRVDAGELRRAAAKYGAAVAYAVSMYRHLMAHADYPVEVEVSVDETEDPTTLAEHIYMAMEMKRLGMKWTSFAPRYIGGFEKGVEYIGDREAFYDSLVAHADIAMAFGPYKISLHSGSDKFSIYELAATATRGLVHLKTSGTSYLEAVGISARFAPALFREIYQVSREAYRGARASYQVSAQLDRTPAPDDVPDDQLTTLVANFDSRQILHVGYGAVLTGEDAGGSHRLSDSFRSLLETRAEEFESALETHLGRHLAPFAKMSE